MDSSSLSKPPPCTVRPLRCAVYTRTSREGEVDPAFGSITAQQEACFGYIASHHYMSWLPASVSYDDPGITGSTLERPALQRMLADIEAGLVDMVVVYKLDRLSRSLAHFGKLMQAFDRHRVALVCVTQQLNSQDAVGRLAINALMTFAQFERENSGERIRDKIRATRRQGLWAGSVPPMGYEVRGQQLRVIEDEARLVRHIFERFVALGSITELVRELDDKGVTTKSRVSQTGRQRGGHRFDKNYLYKLLNNRTVIGEIKSGETWFPGRHESIVTADSWERAHALLSERRRPRKRTPGQREVFLLKGLVFGTDGRAYSPWRSSLRNGRSYSYYIPQSKIADGAEACDLPRLPAGELEVVVVQHLRSKLREPSALISNMPEAIKQHPTYDDVAASAALVNLDSVWDLFMSSIHRDLMRKLVERVTVGAHGLAITFSPEGFARTVLDLLKGRSPQPAQRDNKT